MSSILRSSAVMAAGTVVSRLSGFVRAALIAAALGVGLSGDVFNVANNVPNSLYILVIGGALNSVLVPQLVRAMKSDDDGGVAYAHRLFTAVLVVLVVVTVFCVAGAEWIVRLYVSNEFLSPDLAPYFEDIVLLARLTFPQIVFYGVYVLVGQMLNARGVFGPMMWSPILNNVVAIVVFGSYLWVVGTQDDQPFTDAQALWLGLGSTAGIAAQALILVPVLRRSGLRLRFRFGLRETGLGKAARLSMWTVFFVLINQVNLIVITRIATGAVAEAERQGVSSAVGWSVYTNAHLITYVPHSVITVSLATAVLPAMAALAIDRKFDALRADFMHAQRLALTVLVPSAAVFALLAAPIARFVFGWGQATGETAAIAQALVGFAPGLVAFTVQYLTLRGFYALEDTRTPFFIQIFIITVNLTCAVTFTALFPVERTPLALALSWSTAYTAGVVVSLQIFARRVGRLRYGIFLFFLLRVAVAGLLGAGGWLAATNAVTGWLGDGKAALAASLTIGAVAGTAIYLLAAWALRVREINAMFDMIVARIGRGKRSPGKHARTSTMEDVSRDESPREPVE